MSKIVMDMTFKCMGDCVCGEKNTAIFISKINGGQYCNRCSENAPLPPFPWSASAKKPAWKWQKMGKRFPVKVYGSPFGGEPHGSEVFCETKQDADAVEIAAWGAPLK